jgi:general secretion pathway protein N
MMSIRQLAMAGVAVFIVGLVALFPARVAYRLLGPAELHLAAIEGTIWQGTAREGEAAGVYFRDLEWMLRPLGLLGGRLALDLSVSPAGGFLETRARIGAGGSIELDDLEGAVSIAALQTVVPTPGIEGNVRLSIDRLAFENGFPVAADGIVDVVSLVVRGLSPSPIGDFRAQLTTGDDAITGSLEDTGGALDLAGSVRLGADRRYVLDGLVAPTPQASSALVNQLQFLGSANERGQRPFRLEGQL